jgi:hypothetical protein
MVRFLDELVRTVGYQEPPNHSLERTRPRRRDTMKVPWPGRSARNR